MQFVEEHNFLGGMDTDSDLRKIDSSHYRFAQDVEHYDDTLNTFGATRPMRSTKFGFDIGQISPQNQIIRCTWNSGQNDYYQFDFYNTNGNFLTTTGIFQTNSFATIKSTVEASLTAIGISATATQYLSTNFFTITFNNNINYLVKEQISTVFPYDWVKQVLFTIQEAYDYIVDIEPLQFCYLNENIFFFSRAVNHDYCEIGGATQDVNGVWHYHIIGSSSAWNFPTTEVIDPRIELRADNKYSLYFTDNTNKPRVFYFPIDYTVNANSGMKFASNFPVDIGNPEGLYTYESIVEQTNLQLLNNRATIELDSQMNSGGALPSGSVRYCVRLGVYGTNNTTPFSYLSGNIIVYSQSSETRNAGNIKGDDTSTSTVKTTKANILRIKNANPNVFGYAEVGCVQYQGGAVSFSSIGKFVIPSDEFTVTHTGAEIGATALPLTAIPNVTPVIIKAKNEEIKKNRLNQAAVELAVDEDLRAIASAIEITGTKSAIGSIGKLTEVNNIDVFGALRSTRQIASSGFDILIANTISYDNFPVSYSPITGVYTVTTATQGNTIFSFQLSLTGGNALPVDFQVYLTRERSSVRTNIVSLFYHLNENESITTPVIFGIDASLPGDQYGLVLEGTNAVEIVNVIINSLTCTLLSSSVLSYKNELIAGEYQLAENTSKKLGYMFYETYAFFLVVKYINGYISNPYFIGYYSATPTDLTDDSTAQNRLVFVPHPIFNNIDISTIKDRISGFKIVRAVCNPTVLGQGVYMPANLFGPDGYYTGEFAALPFGSTVTYGDLINNSDNRRYFGSFISSDFMLGTPPAFSSSDKLVVYSQPTVLSSQANIFSSSLGIAGNYCEYLGNNVGSIDSYNIDDSQYIKYEGVAPDYSAYSKYLKNSNGGINPNRLVLAANSNKETMFQSAFAITTDNKVFRSNLGIAAKDLGVYGALIYRPLINQYDLKNVDIIDCGHDYNVTATTPNIINGEEVFGGDVYTQRVYVRVLSNAFASNASSHPFVNSWCSFIGYYAQNRINVQMRHGNLVGTPLFPADARTLNDYLFSDVRGTGQEVFAIDGAYEQGDNKINIAKQYNDKNPGESKFGARIYYTEQKPTGSIYDSYRDIRPLDFHDLDSKNGIIVALNDVNNTMMTIQSKAVTVLPYQSDVLVKSDSGAEIYIGNGGVYAQRETIVSTYGTNIKTATYAGYNKNGNSNLYWLSTNKRLMRYNYDGIKTISEDAKTRNFLLNNTTFITREFDVIMGFDIRRDNLWVTARAQNNTIAEWASGQSYVTGNSAKISTPFYTTEFEQLPDIYVAAQNNTNSPPYIAGADWNLIPHTDNTYYNEWTMVYNETLNACLSSSSLLPKRYFLYKDLQLIPRGRPSYGRVYEMNTGSTILEWLDQNGTIKLGTYIIEPVINKTTEGTKTFLSIGLNTGENNANNPTIFCTTKTQDCFMVPTDFEQINAMIFVGVKWDVNGDQMQGEYMIASIQTQQDISILDMVAKINYRSRYPNK